MVDTTYIFSTALLVVYHIATGALLVFLLFVQVRTTLIYTLGKQTWSATMIVNALGRKWSSRSLHWLHLVVLCFVPPILLYQFGGAYWV